MYYCFNQLIITVSIIELLKASEANKPDNSKSIAIKFDFFKHSLIKGIDSFKLCLVIYIASKIFNIKDLLLKILNY